MFRLPNPSSPLRQLFDIGRLAVIAAPENRATMLPRYAQAVFSAKQWLTAEKAARSLHLIAIRPDGELWLVRVGKRGGVKRLWNFGVI